MGEPATQNPQETGNLEPFQPGPDARRNKGGRPKGLAKRVREIVGDDGEAIARTMMSAMLGRLPNPEYDTAKTPEQQPGVSRDEIVQVKDRLYAGNWLAERGWGKAPQYAPMDVEDPLELTDAAAQAAAEELDRKLDELAERRRQREQGAGSADAEAV